MPRIFKGSESTLRLLISKTGDYQALTEIKIKLYTTDIENAIEIIDGIQVCKNIAIITLAPRAFMGMEDGLINYIIDGATEDDVFHTERQSNYMLKSLSYINEDGVATQTMTIESNGEYRVTPNNGLYVDINVNVPDLNGSYDDGFNVGYGQGKTDGVNEQKSKLETISITENGTYTKEDGYNHIEVNVPDLNGSYDEGYAQGKTDGVNEQKSKLETINITENGTYTKEDGYNHIEVNVPDLNGSYDEGYADAAAKARVLNVTENGTYLSKFSDPIPIGTITGVYNDGTEFNNYAELNGKVFNTKIASSVNSRLEFWYKGDNTINGGGWNLIIGAGNSDDTLSFQVKYFAFNNNKLCMDGASRVIIDGWDDTIWHHLIVSETEGIWIDGEKKGDFPISTYIKGEFFINGIGYDTNGTNTANGTFGMIKIDDVVIIPTADGFLNTNTGELLEVVKDGGYTYTEGQVKYGEGELYKTINVNVPDLNGSYDEGKTDGVNEQKGKLTQIRITENGTYAKEDGYSEVVVDVPDLNGSYDEGYAQGKTDGVSEQKSKLETISITENGTYTKEDGYNHIEVNVPPKINIQEAGIKFAYSTFTEVPESADFNGVTNMTNMFYKCSNLQTIPLIDTSNVTNMSYMFCDCGNLQTISLIDTSNVADMAYMFQNCSNLQTIPLLNTSNVTTMNNMFQNCSNLQTIPLLNTSNVTNMYYMFNVCFSLQTIPLLNTSNVTNMGYMFNGCSNLQTIPQIDTSNVTNMNSMFNNCTNLQAIPQLNTSNVTNMSYMFRNCSDLQTIPQLNTSNVTNMSHMFFMEVKLNSLSSLPKFDCQKVNAMDHYFSGTRDGMSTLTDVGGWENLKCNWNDRYGLASCPNLTYESCINVLNGLYDFTGNGETPRSNQGKLKVHPNFSTTVGDKISIGMNKGWQITV